MKRVHNLYHYAQVVCLFINLWDVEFTDNAFLIDREKGSEDITAMF